jgi:phosphoglycolate phosphatase
MSAPAEDPDRAHAGGRRMSGPGHRASTLLFDLDGTLVDSYEPIARSLNSVRAACGLPPLPLAEVRRRVGHGLESLIEANVGPARVREGVTLFRETYRQVFRAGTRLLPGVAATLETLSARGYRMGVVSNKPAYFTTEILSALGLSRHFGPVRGPDATSPPKPDPAMVRGALRELDAGEDETILIGDMSVDILTARSAGVRVWAVPGGSESRDSLRASAPDLLLDRFEDLASLLPATSPRVGGEPAAQGAVEPASSRSESASSRRRKSSI